MTKPTKYQRWLLIEMNNGGYLFFSKCWYLIRNKVAPIKIPEKSVSLLTKNRWVTLMNQNAKYITPDGGKALEG